jgi:hypothetical protein
MHRLHLFLFIGVLGFAAPAAAQLSEAEFETIRMNKVINAVQITEPITLDGQLDEPVWQTAQPATDFYQKLPRNGTPASERTEVRFAYDEDNLYVGVTAFDSDPDRLLIKDLREDFDFGTTDLIQIFIDSLRDGRSGFTFVVNPAGARRDTQVSNNGTTNQDWDGVWDAKVSRNEKAWFVEYMIPFRTLRFSQSSTQEWGLNVTRKIMHRSEENNWAPIPLRYQGTRAALAGTLRGLEGVRQGRNLKIKPFVIGGGTQARAATALRTNSDFDGGFDVKYSLTPSMTFDATFRTDFAQVEVDQQQVNLTRFNLFFPEKRDFFLENAGIFTFGGVGQSVFSTNVGNLVPFFSRRIGLSAAGTPLPIVGGTRVSGQVKNVDVGVLAMKTERFGATPSNNYVVGRVKKNIFSTSWIGAIVTDRESDGPNDLPAPDGSGTASYNRVYGPDVHLQFDQLEIDSYILRSDTPGREGRNQARKLQTAWRDDELSLSAEYNAVQRNFNPEVGFIRRGAISQYSADAGWRPQLRRSNTIRNLIFSSALDYYDDDFGEIETRTQEGTIGVQFVNNGSVNFSVNETFDRLVEAFAIRPAVALQAGDYRYRRYITSVNTGNNRKVGGTANVSWGDFWDGDSQAVTASLDIRPNYHVNIDLNYTRNQVALPSGEFTAQLLGARLLYGFSPRVFFNAFVQYNADTDQVSSNLRFNFTHHPLSDIYVVYNDRRDTSGRLVERAFIVKVTNLFTF